MSTLIQAKQVYKLLIAPVYMSGWAVPSSSASIVLANATLTTALNGAPLQVANSSAADMRGLVTSGTNIVAVWATGTRAKVFTPAGNEIYARLTSSASVYTATFYINLNGVETSYTFASATTLDLVLGYQFDLGSLPVDSLMVVPERYVDPSSASGSVILEVVAVTGTDVLAATVGTPNPAKTILLFVNGQVIDMVGGTPAFSIAGNTITWQAANAGFHLALADRVLISYSL